MKIFGKKGASMVRLLICLMVGAWGSVALGQTTAKPMNPSPKAANIQDAPINPTLAFRRHKGFMVFLNWHFLQEAPMLVTKHFKRVASKGPWHLYRGHYGGFDQVDVGVCQGKITEVRAKSKPLPGGIGKFLETWLEPRLLKLVVSNSDDQEASRFYIKDPGFSKPCRALAGAIANPAGKRRQL